MDDHFGDDQNRKCYQKTNLRLDIVKEWNLQFSADGVPANQR